MSDLDEQLAALVPRAQAGHRRSLSKIIRLIHPPVLRYARSRIGGSRFPTPEDVAQEICLAVANSIGSYQDQGRPFMAYVYGVAQNKVTDAHRALGRDKTNPTDEVPDVPATGITPEEHALVLDGSNEMRRLLDTLNDNARHIVILRVFVGLSAEETAEVVGSTPGAVRVAQHRAITQLRKALKKEA